MSEPKYWWRQVPLAETVDAKPNGNDDAFWREQPLADDSPKMPVWSGGMLPVSETPDGKAQFDSNAGILGALKRAVTLPGDVYRGKVDPMTPEGIDRANELAGVASPMSAASRSAGVALKAGRPEVPSAKALSEAAGASYDRVRDMKVDYSGDAFAAAMRELQQGLEQDGIIGELAPKTYAVLKKLTDPPEGAIAPLNLVEAARRAAGHAQKDFQNPTDQLAGSRLVRGIDQFIDRGGKGDGADGVVAGPAAAAAAEARTARENYAAAARSERLAGKEDAAELRAAAANSGRNFDNTIRSRSADILLRPREVAGFNEAERAALEEVVRGNFLRNRLRDTGNALGGGGGLGAAVTGGGAGAMAGTLADPYIGAAVGLAVPALGMTARALANRQTHKAYQAVDEMTRMRSPLYEEALRNPPSVLRRDAIAGDIGRRSLLGGDGPAAKQDADAALQRSLLKLLMEGGA